jgi:hypothetical protein
MIRTLIQHIASTLQARENCKRHGNTEWYDRHSDALAQLAYLLPSGSGVDNGTSIDVDACKADRIVLQTSFHHMDESGGYDGWTEHAIIVRPTFDGIDVDVKGRDRNGIKDYLGELFAHALTVKYTWTVDSDNRAHYTCVDD